eukprot:PhF_6_TR25271/c0_g1_i2/m.34827
MPKGKKKSKDLEEVADPEGAAQAAAEQAQRIQRRKEERERLLRIREELQEEQRAYHTIPQLHPHPLLPVRLAIRHDTGVMPNGSFQCKVCHQLRYEWAHVCFLEECGGGQFTCCPECFSSKHKEHSESKSVMIELAEEGPSTSNANIRRQQSTVSSSVLGNSIISKLHPDIAILPPLLRATVLGDTRKVIELLDKNEFRNDLDLEATCPVGKYKMKTALLLAAECDQPQITFHLLNKGALINATDFRGYTPLMMAAFHGHVRVMDELLYKGVKTEMQSQRGNYTALHLAACMGHAPAVSRILANHANVNARNSLGRTALIIAALNGHEEVARVLAKHPNVDLTAKDEEGYTAGVAAAASGHYNISDLLNESFVE